MNSERACYLVLISLRKMAVFFSFYFLSAIILAAETLPATFDSAEQSFLEEIAIPSLEAGTTLVVKCGGWLGKRGRFSQVACYQSAELTENIEIAIKLNRTIPNAARKKKFTPAIVHGLKTKVWVNFSVIVDNTGGVQTARVVLNHQYNEAQYGEDYVSAQRYNARSWRCSLSFDNSFGVLVSSEGEAKNVRPAKPGLSKRCENRISRALERSRYIPAHLDGNPVDSMYVELFFSPNNYKGTPCSPLAGLRLGLC